MKIIVAIAAVLGICVAAYFIMHVGTGAVISTVARVGWRGFAIICVLGLGMFALLGTAWFTLIPSQFAPRLSTFMWGRAVRDSAAEVLPLSQFGGFVIGARAVSLLRIGMPMAFGSTIVDVTTELAAQAAFVLAGVAILVTRVPKSASGDWLANTAMAGSVVAAVAVLAFLAVQRRAFGYAEKLGAHVLPKAAAQAGAVHDAIGAIHASPLRLFASACVHLLGWFASAFLAFVALRLMGIHAAFASIVSIEALLCAIRSAAVIVPNAIGVQEAAYAMLMPLFGIAAPVGVALSLLRRARDISLGVPILLAWQAMEGRRALTKQRRSESLIEGSS